MNPKIKDLYRKLLLWGWDPKTTLIRLASTPQLLREQRRFRIQLAESTEANDFAWGSTTHHATDRGDSSGIARGQYFHQDLVVAQAIFQANPVRHIDVGSRIDGFVAHLASFREVDVLDIRPPPKDVSGINFYRVDVMQLPSTWFGAADSVSSLHAIEHFGLGRYGDAIHADGWRLGLTGLFHLVRPQGIVYVSLPTGEPQRVEFNSQRVFSLTYLYRELASRAVVERVDFVDDEGHLAYDVAPDGQEGRRSFGARSGCSIWHLRKR